MSLNLKKRKKPGGKRRLLKVESFLVEEDAEDDDVNMEEKDVSVSLAVNTYAKRAQADEADHKPAVKPEAVTLIAAEELEDDTDDPLKTVPLTRYNAMLAVVRNTLFMCVQS